MEFRSCQFSLSILLALFTRTFAVAARNPSLAELRGYLKNTTDHKCWCEECKSTNGTHLNYYVWFACEQLMENMFLRLNNDQLYYGDILHSMSDMMFDKQDFCEEKAATIPPEINNGTTDSPHSYIPGKTVTFTDRVSVESCLHPNFTGIQQNQFMNAESNQLYWIIPLISFVLLVNVVGGIYFYFRFAKIESYHRHMERQTDPSTLLDSFSNGGNI